MSPRVILHVGAMKSGTSYVQALLYANQAILAERGVLVPGVGWQDQVRAVQDVLGRESAQTGDLTGCWDRMVDQIKAHDGTAVVSMEFLGPAPSAAIERIVSGLDDVTVVVTARDLSRALVSMWQETVQNGRSWTFADYLAGARDGRPRPGRRPEDLTVAGKTFWRQQNVVRLCRNWSAGGARVVLLTVPPRGAPRDLLRDRFLSVVGTTADGLVPAPGANESIGAASAMVLRRVNELLDEAGLPSPRGQHLRKEVLAKTVLAAAYRLRACDRPTPHAVGPGPRGRDARQAAGSRPRPRGGVERPDARRGAGRGPGHHRRRGGDRGGVRRARRAPRPPDHQLSGVRRQRHPRPRHRDNRLDPGARACKGGHILTVEHWRNGNG